MKRKAKHKKLLAIRVLEDVLTDNLKVKEYRECAGIITLKLEREDKCNDTPR